MNAIDIIYLEDQRGISKLWIGFSMYRICCFKMLDHFISQGCDSLQGQFETLKQFHFCIALQCQFTYSVCSHISISFSDIKGDLIGMIFHKGSSICPSSGHYISMISVIKIWYLCRHWAGTKGHHLLSEQRNRRQNSISTAFPEDFVHYLSCFAIYCYDCGSWFCFKCSGLVYEIYSRGGPSSYVYCVVYFCIDVITCAISVNCFWLFHTLDDELEHSQTMTMFIL